MPVGVTAFCQPTLFGCSQWITQNLRADCILQHLHDDHAGSTAAFSASPVGGCRHYDQITGWRIFMVCLP
jgi:hypothetical protein